MYAVSEDRPRGTSAGQTSREFPVLFHLMDVSRPRAKPTPTIESANILSAVEQLRWPPVDEIESSPAELTAPEPTTASAESPVGPESSSPSFAPQAVSSTVEAVSIAEPAVTSPSAEETVATEEAARQPIPSTPLVTLRKKSKTPPSEDWFASHGKFIAVAFVLALAATIYFARVSRERGSLAKQDSTSESPLIETSPVVASGSQASPGTAASPSTVQTASAATSTSPMLPSPVELKAPELVGESSGNRPKDNLFEFAAAKASDDRVAARSDEAARSAPMLTAPSLSPPALTAPSPSASPEVIATPVPQASPSLGTAETAAYPVTSSPAAHYPVSIPPAATYPSMSQAPAPAAAPVLSQPDSTNYSRQPQFSAPAAPPIDYRSQYPVTPASTIPPQPAAQGWNAGQPTSYPTYDTTARGPRNERTGSGTY